MDERQVSVIVKPRGRSSFLKKLFPCFSPGEQLSESSLNSDYEYVVENKTVYKVPHRETLKDGQSSSKDYKSIEHSGRHAELGCSRQDASWSRPNKSLARERFLLATLHRRRVYEYVRMKTYQNMNPYRMSPNDFLNNISSVFVENLKDPIPKDPNCLPRVYNNQPYGFSPEKPLTFKTIYRNSETETDDIAFSYREALEDDQPYQQEEEKVLVWKIVIVHQNNEDKQK